MQEIFDNYLQNTLNKVADQEDKKMSKFRFNYRQFFPHDRSSRLLDVGVGRGEMLRCMRELGYSNILGIDISSSTITHCSAYGLPCEQVRDSTQWLLQHKDAFDMITLLDVLEHVPKKEVISILCALKDSLHTGGRLVIQVPNMQAPDCSLHRYGNFTHETGFTERILGQVLMVAGFPEGKFPPFEEWGEQHVRFGKMLRSLYWKWIRARRALNTIPNPTILSPDFFTVAGKRLE